jgi:ABC-type sugar transport system substrate-binding protein
VEETCAPFSSGLATSAQFDTFITKGVDVIVFDSTDVLGAATNAQRAIEARHKHNRCSHTPVCIKATLHIRS